MTSSFLDLDTRAPRWEAVFWLVLGFAGFIAFFVFLTLAYLGRGS